MADTKKKWKVILYNCSNGCNNSDFNPGCDESLIIVKIDIDIAITFGSLKFKCPRCGIENVQIPYIEAVIPIEDGKDFYIGSTIYSKEAVDVTKSVIRIKIEDTIFKLRELKTKTIPEMEALIEGLRKFEVYEPPCKNPCDVYKRNACILHNRCKGYLHELPCGVTCFTYNTYWAYTSNTKNDNPMLNSIRKYGWRLEACATCDKSYKPVHYIRKDTK